MLVSISRDSIARPPCGEEFVDSFLRRTNFALDRFGRPQQRHPIRNVIPIRGDYFHKS